MKTKLHKALCLILAMSLNNIFAQDTLKIGVNSEIIEVAPPKMNQKVKVNIEDSNFYYQIDIYKLAKTKHVSVPQKGFIKFKDQKVSSKLLNEAELGFAMMPSMKFVPVRWGSASDLNYLNESFIANGENFGTFGNINVKSKQRSLTGSGKLYFGNATQVRINYNEFQGKMEYIEIFGKSAGGQLRPDSIGKTDIFPATLESTRWYFTKRLSLGWLFNEKHNFSVEYGMDVLVRFFSKTNKSVYNTNSEFNERAENFKILSHEFFSDPLISFYHRIGINYRRVTLNAGISNTKYKVGNKDHSIGRMMNIGLAFRLR
ncbi:MAG: hypothetical protein H6605_06580 [Flavobacteriales bacterium]|nr:hypothetical protein [Flavobacteriales bacterium]